MGGIWVGYDEETGEVMLGFRRPGDASPSGRFLCTPDEAETIAKSILEVAAEVRKKVH